MQCSVEGCSRNSDGRPTGSKEVNLCDPHLEAWGYYRLGYYEAMGKKGDGCLHRPLWRKAMKTFLESCRVEIVACTQIAEALLNQSTEQVPKTKD